MTRRLVRQTEAEAAISVCAGCILIRNTTYGLPCPAWEKRGLKCTTTRNGDDRTFDHVWVRLYGPKVRK